MSKTRDAGPAPEITEPATSTPARRGLDPELQAMAKLDRTIAELPEGSIGRVLAWLIGRHAPGCKVYEVARMEAIPPPEPAK